MKITYIKEGYFKNIDDMRANAQKSNSLSKEERVNNLKAEARKFIQDVASERFDVEFKELVVGTANSIFLKSLKDNKIALKEIKYFFEGNVIHAEFHIGIGSNGKYLGGNTRNCRLTICYPENINEIENSLKDEYGYDSKAEFIFECDDDNASLFFNPVYELTPNNASQENLLFLETTDCTDLTDFCYFLNSCNGIDFSEFTLSIKNHDNGTELLSTSSKVELNNKFQKVNLHGFYPTEVELTPILSNEIITEKHAAQLSYKGRWEDTQILTSEKITGILHIAPVVEADDVTIEYILNLIKDFMTFAERMSAYKNLYVICTIPSYNSGLILHSTALLTVLSTYLCNDYKKANQQGYNIEDPGNITLTLQLGYSTTHKIGIFPFMYYGELNKNGGFVKRT